MIRIETSYIGPTIGQIASHSFEFGGGMYEHTQPNNYWYTAVHDKLVWAVIYPLKDGSCLILFLDEKGYNFESLDYPSWERSTDAMFINGFTRYVDDEEAKQRIIPPSPPFRETSTLDELMIFFKESWIEPTFEGGTIPKTDWDSILYK